MSTSAISVLGKLFYEPASAFASLKEESKPWLPLVLIIASSLAIFFGISRWWISRGCWSIP